MKAALGQVSLHLSASYTPISSSLLIAFTARYANRPGSVATEFSEAAGYPPGWVEAIKQLDPLQAKEIALVVIQVLEQSPNVDIGELTVYPTKQTVAVPKFT